jgi:hypothetical protein
LSETNDEESIFKSKATITALQEMQNLASDLSQKSKVTNKFESRISTEQQQAILKKLRTIRAQAMGIREIQQGMKNIIK